MKNPFSLEDEVVLITGGSGLLGKVLVKACLDSGARVAVFDVRRDEGLPKEAAYYDCDITRTDSVAKAIESLLRDLGRVDVLVNNAYPQNKGWGKIFEEITLPDWCDNVNQHLGGYFNVTQQVSRQMIRQKSGNIIMMASIYGMVGPDFSIYEETPMTMPAEYAAIKGGLINFTRYLATYLARHNIRVNAISPGGIFSGQDARFVERYKKKVPLGRMGEPEDVSGALIFLASDASRYVTGQNIAVDGGWTAW